MTAPSDEELVAGLTAREHGFTHVRHAAQELWQRHAASEVQKLAHSLYGEEPYQKRMCAVFLFAMLAVHDGDALRFLRDNVADDPDWRVQEVLAKAFDYYCHEIGYEPALPDIEDWLGAARPNTRRAVIEGLRVWTKRPYFREHPRRAVALISGQLGVADDYLRRSAENSLRDVRKTHPGLVRDDL